MEEISYNLIMNAHETFDSFYLDGKITKKHAEHIKNILKSIEDYINKNMNETKNNCNNPFLLSNPINPNSSERFLAEQVSKLIDQQILIIKRIEAIELFLKS